jgi:hypothetical protein
MATGSTIVVALLVNLVVTIGLGAALWASGSAAGCGWRYRVAGRREEHRP